MTANANGLVPSENPDPGTFEAIYAALDASSRETIGPAQPRLLVIPIRADDGAVKGGLWGETSFGWLHVQMLFVPEQLRGRGVGSSLMALAETEARLRGCCGAHLDAFSFQAAPFYRKLGFETFGQLDGFPPGHRRLYLSKLFVAPEEDAESASSARIASSPAERADHR